MIVSHRHRFIFLAVPKTGSQSVRAVLRKHLGAEDWEQADWRTRKRLPIPELAAVGHGHLSVRDVAGLLDESVWSGYFKFAFVRNPWDRFVSSAYHDYGRGSLFAARPRAVMRLLLQRDATMEGLFFRPQSSFLIAADEAVAVDFVGRFETLGEDFAEVCRRIGLKASALPRLNPSGHGDWQAYYDDDLRTRVAERYERDIQAFDYRFCADADDRAPVLGDERRQDRPGA